MGGENFGKSSESKPSSKTFYKNRSQGIGNKGDLKSIRSTSRRSE